MRAQPLPSQDDAQGHSVRLHEHRTPAGKLRSSFTVTSIISGLPDMRTGFHHHQPFPQPGEEGNQRGVYANRSPSLLPKASSA